VIFCRLRCGIRRGNEGRFSASAKPRKIILMQTPKYFQRLEMALARQRRTKGALAAHLGVALSTVSRWRHSMPLAETVQATADWLGVDAKWLMTGEEIAESSGHPKEPVIPKWGDDSTMVREDVVEYRAGPARRTKSEKIALLEQNIDGMTAQLAIMKDLLRTMKDDS
jgi:transcriptional regulator with XRE-family HTH domain